MLYVAAILTLELKDARIFAERFMLDSNQTPRSKHRNASGRIKSSSEVSFCLGHDTASQRAGNIPYELLLRRKFSNGN